jgi:hypothetical protein
MRHAPSSVSAKRRRASFLMIGAAVIGLVLSAAAPRARACDIGDDVDAEAAQGLSQAELATSSMSCKLLVPGPHIRVTPRSTPSAADIARADRIRAQLRQALGKYEDYRAALEDGFDIRFPNLRQKVYHFSNRANAVFSARIFDPLRPTSLLYDKDGGRYKLVGVMYTAPRYFSLAELDSRFPISVEPWHQHINICRPPAYSHYSFAHDARFGPNGTIATREACLAVGGTFEPVIYGWMIHVDFDGSDDD